LVKDPAAPMPMGYKAPASRWTTSRPLPAEIEAELAIVERTVTQVELEMLRDLRAKVADLDNDIACAVLPHALRAVTLLRFLRARNGNVQKAAALFRDAMQWRAEFDLDNRLKAWRQEWQECVTPRAKLLKRYNFIALLGKDKWGLPTYICRFGQGDPGGLVREVGADILLLHNLNHLEQQFAAAQELMLSTGTLHHSFVECYDLGNYGFVGSWLQRGLATAKPYARYAKVFDSVYPERVRVALLLRAPRAFSMIWKLMVPLVPEQTLKKIRLMPQRGPTGGPKGGTREDTDEEILAELANWLPRATIPVWLETYDLEALKQATPWGGIVPKGAVAVSPAAADCDGDKAS